MRQADDGGWRLYWDGKGVCPLCGFVADGVWTWDGWLAHCPECGLYLDDRKPTWADRYLTYKEERRIKRLRNLLKRLREVVKKCLRKSRLR